ncbi:increased recombination centers protein 22 [Scheffersomyces coipomensis]|uniref:increased recombination centers protein 22 n=1 Tax=Scheffersomyces coipomensis TaxID=1788519 RepID=UPI00315C7D6A
MKFSTLFASVIAATTALVSAYEVDPTAEHNTINFFVDYAIKEVPKVRESDVAELNNGQSITIQYTAVNKEEFPVLVIGIGGTFNDPVTNEIVSNLTIGNIGPITIAPGESQNFEQKMSLNLVPNNYLINPQLFVAIDEQVILIPIRGQFATISDLPISFFNPQLLFLELVLIASFGGLLYFLYEAYGKQYINGTGPIALKAAKKAAAAAPSSGAGTSTALDDSWLPDHLKQKKAKKAN